jgi:hypothetical protein
MALADENRLESDQGQEDGVEDGEPLEAGEGARLGQFVDEHNLPREGKDGGLFGARSLGLY